jgi:hypothetical protein
MTAAETIRKLKTRGASDELASGIVEAMEDWEQNRGVSRDHLESALGRLEARLTDRFALTLVTALLVQATAILGGVCFMLVHFKA